LIATLYNKKELVNISSDRISITRPSADIDHCREREREAVFTYPEPGGVHQFVNDDAHVDATAPLLMVQQNSE
jgi:hypothetical protein